jgi:TPR repeat protein
VSTGNRFAGGITTLAMFVLGGCKSNTAPSSDAPSPSASSSGALPPLTASVLADADTKATEGFRKWDGQAEPKNQREAQRLFIDACDKGSQLGCAGLGLSYLDGVDGTGKDYEKALRLLQPACDAKVGRACSCLGGMNTSGNGVPKDRNKATQFYRTACELAELRGCRGLAAFYQAGEGGLPKDMKQGFDLYKKACDGGLASGCSWVANSYLRGYGVSKSRESACTFAQKACDGNDGMGCEQLAHCFSDGITVPKDAKKAVELARRSCEVLGHARGCGTLGGMLLAGDGGRTDAAKAFEKACDGDDADGCFGLAMCQRQGWGVSASPLSADQTMKKACDLGSASACKEFRR